MSTTSFLVPLPTDPCPPADNPEAILLWIYWQHLRTGRIMRRCEHHDPFWRRIDEKREDRMRMTVNLETDPHWEQRVRHLAAIFDLDLSGKSKAAQIEAVSCAFVPMRFHLSGALEELGEIDRAAEVLVAAY